MESDEKEKNIVPVDGRSRSLKKYEENIEIVSTPAADGVEIDPYTYLHVIWKHRKISLIFLLTVVVTAILISIFTKPMYKATSSVEVALERPQIVSFKEVLEDNTQTEEFYNTQSELIMSRSMAEAVLSKYNVWDDPEFSISEINFNPIPFFLSSLNEAVDSIKLMFSKPEEKDAETSARKAEREKIRRDGKINQFLSRVKVNPGEKSRIIIITFEAYNPTFAAKIADAIADTFVSWSLDRKLEANRSAREFINRQLSEVKTDLEKSEVALHKYSAENNIVSLDANQNLILGQLTELDRSLAQVTAEKTAKESLYRSVEAGNPNEIMEVLSDPIVQGLKAEYNRLLVDYSNLSASFKPDYPPLKQLQAKIDEIRARLNEETKRRTAAIKADFETSVRREGLLKERAQEQEQLALALSEKTIQYRSLEREVQSNKSIYESLLQRSKETEVSGGIKSGNIQVVDRAAIPLSPFKPNTPRNTMLAILVGLIGGVGIAFALEFFDRTVKTPEEIHEKMRLPVLGAVFKLPESSGLKKLENPIEKRYMLEPMSPFSEAIRTLRASIMLSSQSHSLRSILVTSCWPGEGKTTIAANLATSLAFGTNRVLLVEADLRHPTLSDSFGISRNSLGISNYLMFHSDIRELVHSTDIPQLFVLPSGSINPSNPSELVHSQEMKELLSKLRSEFDYLIIDSSPAIGMADAFVLSTIVDGTILVAGAGMTMRKDISHVVNRLSNLGGQFLGVVINRLESGHDSYYYSNYDQYYNKARDLVKEIRITTSDDLSTEEKLDENGELNNNSYPNLLISLLNRKKTGVLTIDSHIKLRIYFLEGYPVSAEGGDSETLLGKMLVTEGRISQENHQKALSNLAQSKKRLGEVLIEMGLVSSHELDRLLENQIKQKLIRGFECTTGTYNFKTADDFVKSVLVHKINPYQMVYEGIKRFGDSSEIEKKFFTIQEMGMLSGINLKDRLSSVKSLIEKKEAQKEPFSLEGLIVHADPEFAERLREIAFGPTEFRFLQSLKKSTDLEYILSSSRLSRVEALKLLYFLNLAGFIDIKVKEFESEGIRHSANTESLTQQS